MPWGFSTGKRDDVETGMAPSMGVPLSRRPEARGIHGWFLSATPLLVLGLAIFVVALNVRHYSTMCGSESARDEVLNKAAMERRIRTLENEIAQNGVLLKKVLAGLESRFDISSFSVEELRQLAQMEAEDIAQRRARLPPPPMSEYAKAKVSAAVEGGNMQDLVEGAVSPVQRSTFDEFVPAEGQNEGWDWGPQSSSVYEDDFLGIKKVESIKPPTFDVSDEEREKLCHGWMSEHKVVPGVDWGTLRDEDQRKWREYHCDKVVDPAAVNDLLTVFGEPLAKDPGGGFEGGYEYGELYGEGQGEVEGEGGDEQERQGPRRPNDDIVHSDDEVASVPEDSRRAR